MSHPDPRQEYWDNCDGCNKWLQLSNTGNGAVCDDCIELCMSCFKEECDPDFEDRCYECGFENAIMRAESAFEGDR